MPQITNVNAATLKTWLDNNEAVLIDVREAVEYNTENIPHAKNRALSQVSIDEVHLPEHKDNKLVFHCQTGRRSMMACEKLMADGAPYDIWNLEGGIVAWKESNFATNTGDRRVLPIDRQVQIAVGSVLILAHVLGFMVSSNCFFLSLAAGLGLLNAGVTGWCGMGMLLSKMPWNKG